MLDFVYIVKESDKNDDLKYSLRSIAKFYPDHRVWIVGYKPKWVQNVGYIPVKQTGNKWGNSVKNIIAACESKEISEDFILMNDDFFIIKEKYPLETVCNMNSGTLDKAIKAYGNIKYNSWCKAFSSVKELLQKIGAKEPYYNYEPHLPLLINKKKYLALMKLPEVQAFMKSGKVLHKRTLYKNMYKPDIIPPSIVYDVKIDKQKDDIVRRLEVCGWVSVYDNQIGNPRSPKLNFVLHNNFPKPCKYEASSTNPANIGSIITTAPTYRKPSPIKRSKSFIHY